MNPPWKLVNSSSSIWDLVFVNFPSADSTNKSLATMASSLQSLQALRNAALLNGIRDYDCSAFDTHGLCVAVGARQVSVNNGSVDEPGGLLIGSFRADDHLRVGAFVDQSLAASSIANSISMPRNSPNYGVFAVWAERPDGSGAHFRVSTAYGRQDIVISRPVIGDSEPGSGSSRFVTQGTEILARYGFRLSDPLVVAPYLGIQQVRSWLNGYSESPSATVTTPLSYGPMLTEVTAAVAGVWGSYRISPTSALVGSIGAENDLYRRNATFSASGMSGLVPLALDPAPKKTRATASIGAYYDIGKTQRLNFAFSYRQEEFASTSSSHAYVSYVAGF